MKKMILSVLMVGFLLLGICAVVGKVSEIGSFQGNVNSPNGSLPEGGHGGGEGDAPGCGGTIPLGGGPGGGEGDAPGDITPEGGHGGGEGDAPG